MKQKVLYLLSNPNSNVLLDVSYTKLKVNLKNMNIGDAISRNLDNISELTLYVSWWNLYNVKQLSHVVR